jgi:hypothetical protein
VGQSNSRPGWLRPEAQQPTPNTIGTFPIVATAGDAEGNTTTVNKNLDVVDPNDSNPPSVAITSPAGGNAHPITQPVAVTGTVTDMVAIQWWTLSVVPVGGGTSRTIASGTGQVTPADAVLEVVLPMGLVVRVPVGAEASAVARLIAALRAAAC